MTRERKEEAEEEEATWTGALRTALAMVSGLASAVDSAFSSGRIIDA